MAIVGRRPTLSCWLANNGKLSAIAGPLENDANMPTGHSGADKRGNAAWIVHYRRKADEASKLAEAANAPAARASLFGIADDYAAMAEMLERNEPIMRPTK